VHRTHAALGQIPPDRRAYNSDRSFVIGWYVAGHDEDRYDETTVYQVGLFDAQTEEELTFYVTSVRERADTGTQDGQHLASAAFDPAEALTIVLHFADGTEQRIRPLDEVNQRLAPQRDLGVVRSEAEHRVRARMRADAEVLKRKLERKP